MQINRGTTVPGTNDGSFAPHRQWEADPSVLAGDGDDLHSRAARWAVEQTDLDALTATDSPPPETAWERNLDVAAQLAGELAATTKGRRGFGDLAARYRTWEAERRRMARDEERGEFADWGVSDWEAADMVHAWIGRLGIDTTGVDVPLPQPMVDEALAKALEDAATHLEENFGEGAWPVRDGVPQVFEKVGGDPSVLRLLPNPYATVPHADMVRSAVDGINTYLGPGEHPDAYDGPIVAAEIDPDDPLVMRLTVMRRTDPPGPLAGKVWTLTWVPEDGHPDGGYYTGAWMDPE